MIKVVVVDDLKIVRDTVVQLLKQYSSELTVIGEADSVKSALKEIKKHQPDAIFLDIELKDGTGFDLLKQLDVKKYKIVFITAHDEYAVRAFKYSAIDYLLKPIDPDEIRVAINKLKDSIEKQSIEIKFNTLFANFQTSLKEPQKIILKTLYNTYSVDIKDIVRCQADNNYTCFYLVDNRKIMVSITLKEYEELLSDKYFFRIHQSHLINLNFFEKINLQNGSFIIMKDDTSLPLASRKKNDFLKAINAFLKNTPNEF